MEKEEIEKLRMEFLRVTKLLEAYAEKGIISPENLTQISSGIESSTEALSEKNAPELKKKLMEVHTELTELVKNLEPKLVHEMLKDEKVGAESKNMMASHFLNSQGMMEKLDKLFLEFAGLNSLGVSALTNLDLEDEIRDEKTKELKQVVDPNPILLAGARKFAEVLSKGNPKDVAIQEVLTHTGDLLDAVKQRFIEFSVESRVAKQILKDVGFGKEKPTGGEISTRQTFEASVPKFNKLVENMHKKLGERISTRRI